jgi:6-phosphogluconolactonase
MELFVHETPEEVAQAVSATVSESINSADKRYSLGLAGGSTPELTYKELLGTATDWTKVTAWLADERWVPLDADQSNGLMAARTLFDHVPAQLVRPDWDTDLTPEESAARYGRFLKDLHAESGPDMVLLGMGADGHTASLFPRSVALDEARHRYVANTIPETGEVRLTATYRLLRTAERIVFMVAGQAKAKALKASLAGESPAGKVDGTNTKVEWHVDRAAASLVS